MKLGYLGVAMVGLTLAAAGYEAGRPGEPEGAVDKVEQGSDDSQLVTFKTGHPFRVRTQNSTDQGASCVITPDATTGNDWAAGSGVKVMILRSTGKFPGGGDVFFVGPNSAADPLTAVGMCNHAGNEGGFATIILHRD